MNNFNFRHNKPGYFDKFFILFFILSFALAIGAGCGGGGGGGGGAGGVISGAVSGTVRDSNDDSAIPDTTVEIDQVSYISDNGGWYILSGLGFGEKTLVAQAAGYTVYTSTVTIEADGALDYTVKMVSNNTATVEGTVTDINTGPPIENVTVGIGDLHDSTDAAGNYNIPGIPIGTGTQAVNAARPGYDPYSSTVAVIAGQTTTYDFTMNSVAQPEGTCSGVVRKSTNQAPVPGAAVRFTPTAQQFQDEIVEVITDQGGSYDAVLVADRDYELKCLKGGFYTTTYSSGSVGAGGAETQGIDMIPSIWGQFPGFPLDEWGQ